LVAAAFSADPVFGSEISPRINVNDVEMLTVGISVVEEPAADPFTSSMLTT
jgi:hypothetical protein